ncbi:MAG: MFS transporter, partial [Dehalococcoidia bacterium]
MTFLSLTRRVTALVRRPAGAERAKPVAIELLGMANFRWLLLGNALVMMSFQIRNMGQSWLVLELTDSQLWVGIVNGAPAITIMLLGMFGGVIADRLDRRRILIVVRLSLAVLAFGTAFVIASGAVEVWHILLLGVGAGVSLAFNLPTSQVLVQDVVGAKRLMGAAALNLTLSNLGTIIGPAVGGILIARSGVESVFYMLGAMYVVALLATVFLRTEKSAPRPPQPVLRSLVEGLRYVVATPHVAWLI